MTVVLPGYNEGQALESAIDDYRRGLARCRLDRYEIIVVDDGSTDGMGELADRIAAQDPQIRVIHQPNAGQAAAVLRGWECARGEIVTHNGMDLPFDPADTEEAMAPLAQGADVVVVQRLNRRAYGIIRKVISRCNVLLVRLLLGSPFRDHNFVQFYRREVVQSVPVLSRGLTTVPVELILRARRRGYHVVGIDAEYHRRMTGRSTVTFTKVIHAFLETLRLWWLMRRSEPAFGKGEALSSLQPGMGAAVVKSIEPFQVVAGVPARPLAGRGARLPGADEGERNGRGT